MLVSPLNSYYICTMDIGLQINKIIIIMYFRDDEEDKTGASMTNIMFDDQQVSTL